MRPGWKARFGRTAGGCSRRRKSRYCGRLSGCITVFSRGKTRTFCGEMWAKTAGPAFGVALGRKRRPPCVSGSRGCICGARWKNFTKPAAPPACLLTKPAAPPACLFTKPAPPPACLFTKLAPPPAYLQKINLTKQNLFDTIYLQITNAQVFVIFFFSFWKFHTRPPGAPGAFRAPVGGFHGSTFN